MPAFACIQIHLCAPADHFEAVVLQLLSPGSLCTQLWAYSIPVICWANKIISTANSLHGGYILHRAVHYLIQNQRLHYTWKALRQLPVLVYFYSVPQVNLTFTDFNKTRNKTTSYASVRKSWRLFDLCISDIHSTSRSIKKRGLEHSPSTDRAQQKWCSH